MSAPHFESRRRNRTAPTEAPDSERAAPKVDLVIQPAAFLVPGLADGPASLQAKLEVGPADDPAELEADRLADEIVHGLHDAAGGPGVVTGGAAATQRAVTLQAAGRPRIGAAGGVASSEMQASVEAARGKGAALAASDKKVMDTAFGTDFSAVRVHAGPSAAELCSEISARAFTVGPDIFFGGSVPSVATREGTHLLAHELAHTVQQGAVSGARRAVDGLTGPSEAVGSVSRMMNDEAGDDPDLDPNRPAEPGPRTFYKGVTFDVLKKLRDSGLDPTKAGSIGSATIKAAANTGRKPQGLDGKGNFMTNDIEYAQAYAFDDATVIRIELSDADHARLSGSADRERVATFPVPVACLSYRTEPDGEWRPLSEWDKKHSTYLHADVWDGEESDQEFEFD